MIRTIRRVSNRQRQAANLAYWLARPMAERIAAVEALRMQAFPDAEPRLQRVCRVVQRKPRLDW
ncbi:MAG: hypothetical protein H7Z15_11375 [Rhizobacter sp.]|nr:hypothetical protein [Rhizobacter sp.]